VAGDPETALGRGKVHPERAEATPATTPPHRLPPSATQVELAIEKVMSRPRFDEAPEPSSGPQNEARPRGSSEATKKKEAAAKPNTPKNQAAAQPESVEPTTAPKNEAPSASVPTDPSTPSSPQKNEVSEAAAPSAIPDTKAPEAAQATEAKEEATPKAKKFAMRQKAVSSLLKAAKSGQLEKSLQDFENKPEAANEVSAAATPAATPSADA